MFVTFNENTLHAHNYMSEYTTIASNENNNNEKVNHVMWYVCELLLIKFILIVDTDTQIFI